MPHSMHADHAEAAIAHKAPATVLIDAVKAFKEAAIAHMCPFEPTLIAHENDENIFLEFIRLKT